MKYVIVGGLSLDSVINAAGEKMLDQFGGNAAYGCAGARIWAPGEVGMVARRGEGFPSEWLRHAERAGVDVAGVTAVAKPHGLLGGLVYDARGDRDDYVSRDDVMRISGRGGNADMSPLALHAAQVEFGADASDIPAAYNDAEAVHLAPRYLNKQLSCARHYRGRNPGALIILDPIHFYMHLERSNELRELFGLVDALLPSEAEIAMLFGPIAPEEGARLLGDMGARTVVVKLGKEGCLVYERDSGRMTRVPIHPVDARDPTGAGDSFCGGFLVGMKETGDPVQAALYGTVSSSFVVEGFGAEHTYAVTRDMAEKRLAHMRALI